MTTTITIQITLSDDTCHAKVTTDVTVLADGNEPVGVFAPSLPRLLNGIARTVTTIAEAAGENVSDL